MLYPDPIIRISVQEAQKHPWCEFPEQSPVPTTTPAVLTSTFGDASAPASLELQDDDMEITSGPVLSYTQSDVLMDNTDGDCDGEENDTDGLFSMEEEDEGDSGKYSNAASDAAYRTAHESALHSTWPSIAAKPLDSSPLYLSPNTSVSMPAEAAPFVGTREIKNIYASTAVFLFLPFHVITQGLHPPITPEECSCPIVYRLLLLLSPL